MIGKTMNVSYPLKSEDFQAISIMQSIGIDMMVEDNREDFLKEKGLL